MLAQHQRKLAFTTGALSLFIIARLAVEAIATDNWRGLIYSSLHVLVVALGCFFLLRNEE